jgi:hypothetical protein
MPPVVEQTTTSDASTNRQKQQIKEEEIQSLLEGMYADKVSGEHKCRRGFGRTGGRCKFAFQPGAGPKDKLPKDYSESSAFQKSTIRVEETVTVVHFKRASIRFHRETGLSIGPLLYDALQNVHHYWILIPATS